MASRTIGVAFDYTVGSKTALNWTLENLIRQQDTLLIIIVNKKEIEEGFSELWEERGSPLIPFDEISKGDGLGRYGIKKDEELMKKVDAAQRSLKLTVYVKVYWGDAKEKILAAIGDNHIETMVLGSRGLGSVKRAILGSVGSYVVNNATVPVTVVKS
eukprot:TRINITY_DN545_c0_g1_i1.p1 TRINITY_DN545_c0_g1~~TRINITY_DN545_c0_g1_i1.p1  ORF type:complete len:158 (+),score=32.64 TRINITY_DN545_c0_g1_i1:259-732(+)